MLAWRARDAPSMLFFVFKPYRKKDKYLLFVKHLIIFVLKK